MHFADQSGELALIRLLLGRSKSCHPRLIPLDFKYWSQIQMKNYQPLKTVIFLNSEVCLLSAQTLKFIIFCPRKFKHVTSLSLSHVIVFTRRRVLTENVNYISY